MAENNLISPSVSPFDTTPFSRPDSQPKDSASDAGHHGSSHGGASAPAMDRMVRGAHDAVDQIAEKAAPAVDSLRTAAADMSAMQEQWVLSCREHVREHPLASVISAAVAGLVLGRLMAR